MTPTWLLGMLPKGSAVYEEEVEEAPVRPRCCPSRRSRRPERPHGKAPIVEEEAVQDDEETEEEAELAIVSQGDEDDDDDDGNASDDDGGDEDYDAEE